MSPEERASREVERLGFRLEAMKASLAAKQSFITQRDPVLGQKIPAMIDCCTQDIQHLTGKPSPCTVTAIAQRLSAIVASFQPASKWAVNQGPDEFEPQVLTKSVTLLNAPDLSNQTFGDEIHRVRKLGDMHGCLPKAQTFAMMTGIAKFEDQSTQDSDYIAFAHLCHTFADKRQMGIDFEHLSRNKFRNKYAPLLEQLRELIHKIHFAPDAFILFFGDKIMDRNGCDFITFLYNQALRQQRVRKPILLSNHDGAFIRAHESPIKEYEILTLQDASDSSITLHYLLEAGVILQEEVDDLYKNDFAPDLVGIFYEMDRQGVVRVLNSHARNAEVDFYEIGLGLLDIAFNHPELFTPSQIAKLHASTRTWCPLTGFQNADLKLLLDTINAVIHLNAIRADGSLSKLIYHGIDQATTDEKNGFNCSPICYPLYRLIWNRTNPRVAPPLRETPLHFCNGHDHHHGSAHINHSYDDSCGKLHFQMCQKQVMSYGMSHPDLQPMQLISTPSPQVGTTNLFLLQAQRLKDQIKRLRWEFNRTLHAYALLKEECLVDDSCHSIIQVMDRNRNDLAAQIDNHLVNHQHDQARTALDVFKQFIQQHETNLKVSLKL